MATEGPTLIELEARVARLEQRLQADSAPATTATTSGDDVDVFWALHELKRVHPQPAVLYTGVAPAAGGGSVEWQMGHDSQMLLDEDWKGFAAALAALGHPSRLQILQLIARGEAATAADLAHADGLGSTGQIYHHLRQLVAAGWLRSTTKGKHQIPPERLVPLLVILGASS